MVMAFRRDQSPYVGYETELREIDASEDYKVTVYRTYDGDKPAVLKGSALQKLRIEIDERPGSVMIEYKRIAR